MGVFFLYSSVVTKAELCECFFFGINILYLNLISLLYVLLATSDNKSFRSCHFPSFVKGMGHRQLSRFLATVEEVLYCSCSNLGQMVSIKYTETCQIVHYHINITCVHKTLVQYLAMSRIITMIAIENTGSTFPFHQINGDKYQ